MRCEELRIPLELLPKLRTDIFEYLIEQRFEHPRAAAAYNYFLPDKRDASKVTVTEILDLMRWQYTLTENFLNIFGTVDDLIGVVSFARILGAYCPNDFYINHVRLSGGGPPYGV
jgi:hypothetical protein